MNVLLVVGAFLALFTLSKGYNNGVGEFPALGWNTWCSVGNCERDECSETEVKQVAEAMLTNGMFAAGYKRLNLDGISKKKTPMQFSIQASTLKKITQIAGKEELETLMKTSKRTQTDSQME